MPHPSSIDATTQGSPMPSRLPLKCRLPKTRHIYSKLMDYYSYTEYKPNSAQIERNRWVFFGLLRCQPWMAIPAGFLILFCYGSVYAWSVFNSPINKALSNDPDKGRAETTFYIALGVLGVTGAIFGPWIESSHPLESGYIGMVMFFAGHLMAALAIHVKRFALLYFGYGFIAGIGLGIGYVSTIDASSKWWPRARGAAAGGAVMGFGGGALAFSYINKWLIGSYSLSSAFIILGAINISVMFVCIQFICPPPPGRNIEGVPIVGTSSEVRAALDRTARDSAPAKSPVTVSETQQSYYATTLATERPTIHISLGEALKSRDFWLLYVAFLANIVFCLVVLSNLPALINRLFGREGRVPHAPPLESHVAVSIEGAFNMSGRVLVGFMSDMIGRKTTFLILLIVQIVVLACIPMTITSGHFWPFLILIWIATLCYGGGFGMIPAFLSDMYGSSNTSSCHGVFLTAWSIASVGGGLTFTGIVNHYLSSGYKRYDTKPYNVNFAWMMALVAVGLVCCLLMRSSISDRMFPAVPNQILRIRVFGRMLRVLWVRGNHVDDVAAVVGPASIYYPGRNTNSQCHIWRCGRLHLELLSKEQEKSIWEEYLHLYVEQQHHLQQETGGVV